MTLWSGARGSCGFRKLSQFHIDTTSSNTLDILSAISRPILLNIYIEPSRHFISAEKSAFSAHEDAQTKYQWEINANSTFIFNLQSVLSNIYPWYIPIGVMIMQNCLQRNEWKNISDSRVFHTNCVNTTCIYPSDK